MARLERQFEAAAMQELHTAVKKGVVIRAAHPCNEVRTSTGGVARFESNHKSPITHRPGSSGGDIGRS